MPNYAAVGIIGGVIALGFLLWSMWTDEQPSIHHRSDFDPGPGYDRPRSSNWKTDDGEGRRRRRNREEQDCTICQEPIQAIDILTLKCSHRFHRSCLTTWFQERINCPTCRMPA